MTITSIYYFVFILAGAVIYYVIPKKIQWIELLVLSVAFYCLAADPQTLIYLVGSTLIAYFATNLAESRLSGSDKGKRVVYGFLTIAVLLNVAAWFILKGNVLIVQASRYMSRLIPGMPEIAGFSFPTALGMGYYTLQVIGYILDCAWGNIKPQKNPFKLFLFVCFFPQLVTGPISRYSQLTDLYEPHRFRYHNLAFGAQRILWGIFKKIVIAERVGILIDSIWADAATFTGCYHWVALLLYPIQMYTDFSGCMDIVLGTAELFGIRLPENFNNPFFSRTSKEFWQRWHITLGSWAKDYVLYPLLKSRGMIKFGKFTRKCFGKKAGKYLASAVGMLCLWLVMGIWHGAVKYIVGVSLWYWLILMLGELTEPIFGKMTKKLNFKTESFGWHFFQSVRTYLIYAVGAVFFRADYISDAIAFLKGLKELNPWVMFNGSVLTLGITHSDINFIIIGVLLLFLVGVLREKYGYARVWVEKQSFVFRWMIWLFLFAFILIYGKYGPGYSASEFIYKGF